jgi:hypothetical protein
MAEQHRQEQPVEHEAAVATAGCPRLHRALMLLAPDLPLDGVPGSRKHIACGRRTFHVLRTRDSKVHPSRVHALKHFFGRTSVALRDAELLERFRPPSTRDCKGFYVDFQDLTQMSGHFIRAYHRTQFDDAMP